MAITITRQLTKDQYIKLFSNPVSGIACDFGVVTKMENWNFIKDIRYSKSMLLGALKFWLDYTAKYYVKISRLYHPLLNLKQEFEATLSNLRGMIVYVKKTFPDSCLFSHRYINPLPRSKYSKSLKIQQKLLQDIVGINMIDFQEKTLQPYYTIHDYGKFKMEFTVFFNQHPYIPKQKISRVGKTKQGNIFVLHRKDKNGAQMPIQAPKKNLVKRQELYNNEFPNHNWDFGERVYRDLIGYFKSLDPPEDDISPRFYGARHSG
jgi:hypothetical protein